MRSLKSFTYMKNVDDCYRLGMIATELNTLYGYFRKFNNVRTDEALARAFLHAYKHYNESDGELIPYLKALARTIMMITEDEPVEEIEDLAISDEIPVEEQALESFYEEDTNKLIIKKLLIPYMQYFLKLGEMIINSEDDYPNIKSYFPTHFKKQCGDILIKVGKLSFIYSMKYLYSTFEDEINWYLEQADFKNSNYHSIDYSELDKCTAKRIAIVDEIGDKVYMPDISRKQLYVKGANIAGEDVARIKYSDLLYQIEVLSSTQVTNPLAYILGKERIIRTCGGSEVVFVKDIDQISELNRDELIMNILLISHTRLITVGYEYIYVIKNQYSRDEFTLQGLIGLGNVTLQLEPTNIIALKENEVCKRT